MAINNFIHKLAEIAEIEKTIAANNKNILKKK